MVYNFKHPDIYEWIKNNKNYFDLSESLRPDLKDNTNKKVLGKFKDETNSLLITEFLALNPKVYSFKYQDKIDSQEVKNKKTLKGVSKVVVKKQIDHTDYEEVLNTDKTIDRKVTSIRSFNHQLFTYVQKKTALTSFYDKMCMVDNVNCVPFGYVKLMFQFFISFLN
jgi:NurA-like 5'-3' nuclease